jgi:hypothetical protein
MHIHALNTQPLSVNNAAGAFATVAGRRVLVSVRSANVRCRFGTVALIGTDVVVAGGTRDQLLINGFCDTIEVPSTTAVRLAFRTEAGVADVDVSEVE